MSTNNNVKINPVSRVIHAGGLTLLLTASNGALTGLDFVQYNTDFGICYDTAGTDAGSCDSADIMPDAGCRNSADITSDTGCCGVTDSSSTDIALLDKSERQLLEYFAGTRKEFELPVTLSGTPFRRTVWEALLRIPYGEVRTYGEIAREVGCPQGARAVGGACHANPVAIIVPCHRVVGASGALTGFGGGLDVKERLLALEQDNK